MIATLLEQRGDLTGAERAYGRAVPPARRCCLQPGRPCSRSKGTWRAPRAYQRADKARDASGAFNLGLLLEERGRLADAEAAYWQADRRGRPAAAISNLSVLMSPARLGGRTAGAAFRRAGRAAIRRCLATPASWRPMRISFPCARRRVAGRGRAQQRPCPPHRHPRPAPVTTSRRPRTSRRTTTFTAAGLAAVALGGIGVAIGSSGQGPAAPAAHNSPLAADGIPAGSRPSVKSVTAPPRPGRSSRSPAPPSCMHHRRLPRRYCYSRRSHARGPTRDLHDPTTTASVPTQAPVTTSRARHGHTDTDEHTGPVADTRAAPAHNSAELDVIESQLGRRLGDGERRRLACRNAQGDSWPDDRQRW